MSIYNTLKSIMYNSKQNTVSEQRYCREGAPNPGAADQYWSVTCWEPGHGSVGQVHEASFAHVRSLGCTRETNPSPLPLLPERLETAVVELKKMQRNAITRSGRSDDDNSYTRL